ncbi:MAG: hydrogenase expression protein, partial [Nitrospinota bacterium]|nr:hydrogenase expression protein [Nitrospinota bacterium]
LICVDPADVKTLLAALGEAGIPAAAIGKLLPESEGVRMLKDGRKTEIPVFNMDEIGKIF